MTTATLASGGVAGRRSVVDPLAHVRAGLGRAARALEAEGVPVPPLAGKLLRPVVAYAMVPPDLRAGLDGRFWSGALAVQMAHEASVVHDDILDEARERRDAPTLVEERGVGPALVVGDHYLTGAYRAAAGTGSHAFVELFIRAVERTVAAEVRQARNAGRRLDAGTYLQVVTGKSGELFGAAAALGDALLGLGRIEDRVALGRALGALYQKVDDLLDYCPAAATGKAPLRDLAQRKWTWVLDLAGSDDFGPCQAVLDTLFLARDGRPSAARRALSELRAERDLLVARAVDLAPGDRLVTEVVDGWLSAARRGVLAQERASGTPTPPRTSPSRAAEVVDAARALGPSAAWPSYFGRHARTFRLASRLLPPRRAASVSGVYAFCRFTDDLVDAPWDGADPEVLSERLDAWAGLARDAFQGRRTGVPVLDDVLSEASEAGVGWAYPEALIEGVRMDLHRAGYDDLPDLRRYTFGVAAAVGGWISRLFGLRDVELLERAHALGHAMQLTNIVRDVGEDLDRGRLYVPRTLLAAWGLAPEELVELRLGDAPVPGAYAGLMEDLMALADEEYELAWPGIRRLPPWFRRPVAVAAEAYRAIHDEVRRIGYDTLRVRAVASTYTKVRRGASGLLRSARSA